jgi:hypothetical protein
VSDLARLKAAARELLASADPPPGSVGSDRDGSKVYFGPDPVWLPKYEGQAPAVLPAPTTASRQPPDRCVTCGAAFGLDTRRSHEQTCMGCMVNERKDAGLRAEVVRDRGRELERQAREEAEKGPRDFANRHSKKRHKEPA